MGGDHDDRARDFLLFHIGEDVHARDIGELQVQQDRPRHMLFQVVDRVPAVNHMGDRIGFVAEILNIGLGEHRRVLDEQDRGFRAASARTGFFRLFICLGGHLIPLGGSGCPES